MKFCSALVSKKCWFHRMNYKLSPSIVCGYKENFGETGVMLALFSVSKQWKQLSKVVHVYNPSTEKPTAGLDCMSIIPALRRLRQVWALVLKTQETNKWQSKQLKCGLTEGQMLCQLLFMQYKCTIEKVLWSRRQDYKWPQM